jgi:energy-coupling factor transporter ATP-binding protein EcfA2
MNAVAPGWKLRVLLAQALFSNPDILLLDEPTNNLDINTIRWLEDTLNARESTMVIISHDRHFLNMVCTHMADLDYGELRVYPGNYDEYMSAATQARERLLSDNAKKKAQIADLQSFVSRFSANASKSRQATSRLKQIDKIKIEEVKASSRQNPFIRFEQDKKLYRNILEIENLSKGYDNVGTIEKPAYVGIHHLDNKKFNANSSVDVLRQFEIFDEMFGVRTISLLGGHQHKPIFTANNRSGSVLVNGCVSGSNEYGFTNDFLPLKSYQWIGVWNKKGYIEEQKCIRIRD